MRCCRRFERALRGTHPRVVTAQTHPHLQLPARPHHRPPCRRTDAVRPAEHRRRRPRRVDRAPIARASGRRIGEAHPRRVTSHRVRVPRTGFSSRRKIREAHRSSHAILPAVRTAMRGTHRRVVTAQVSRSMPTAACDLVSGSKSGARHASACRHGASFVEHADRRMRSCRRFEERCAARAPYGGPACSR